ncbi:hypothetical protein CHH28_17605 [Bacterioplanes sanyensis]|uniref:DUF2069 domain-containing protein n=1 Tax=Bacterioplanes sanyensis TaxID=1249553 RepID=A0A222FNK8_9GAMM|nr:DUF2069 domain-containing protein [Bacterioplanes sanyensis]ASP40380.1 hypothetical protein CHH28_17605 [Bacterioplanes sanyensis]
MSRNTQLAYRAMLTCYVLMLLLPLYSTLSNPPAHVDSLGDYAVGVLWWLFKVLPLLLFIPGLWQRSHKASAWLSYVAILAFAIIVGVGASPLMILASLGLFLSSMLFTRWAKAEQSTTHNT